MVEVVEVDGSGRIYLPASIRRLFRERRFLVRVEEGRIILVPVKPAIEKYYGVAGPAAYTTDEAVERETRRILREGVR